MNISLIEMMLHAGLVVKAVMIALFIFSVVSWSIIIMKQLNFKRSKNNSEDFLDRFWESKTLNEAYESAQEYTHSPDATMDNVKRAIRKAMIMELDRLGRSLPFLATTGSATPFIGLFGTVWGIMTSFHNIGLRGSASLAVVAPGISEALVATAAGLAVAIPAVIFYNFYSNRLAEIDSDMDHFSTDFLNLVERDFLTRP